MTRILKAIQGMSWAITSEALETIIAAAERQTDIEAVEKKLGYQLENSNAVQIRDSLAIIPISGPLFRYANLFTKVSGATSYQSLATDFEMASKNGDVGTIILNIDSPGGEVTGCIELAKLIKKNSYGKRVVAFIGGQGCSAAYWLASAAQSVYASPTAIAGSIGVQSVITREDNDGKLTFKSSQSPLKNADPESKAGKNQVQTIIDDLATVFISSVAENRGVSIETVAENFGKGGVFVGEKAKAAGLVDEITTFEDMITRLGNEMSVKTEKKTGIEQNPPPITAEYILENHPDIAAHFEAIGTQKENARILGIEELASAGMDDLILGLKKDLSKSPEAAAVEILKHQKSKNSSHLKSLQVREDSLSGLDSNPTSDGDDHDVDAAADLAIEMARKTGVIL